MKIYFQYCNLFSLCISTTKKNLSIRHCWFHFEHQQRQTVWVIYSSSPTVKVWVFHKTENQHCFCLRRCLKLLVSRTNSSLKQQRSCGYRAACRSCSLMTNLYFTTSGSKECTCTPATTPTHVWNFCIVAARVKNCSHGLQEIPTLRTLHFYRLSSCSDGRSGSLHSSDKKGSSCSIILSIIF